MLRIIKWIGVPILAVALLTGLDAPKAEAGNGFSLQIGRFGISTGNRGYGSSFNRGYNQRSLGYNAYYGAGNYGIGNYGIGNTVPTTLGTVARTMIRHIWTTTLRS